MAYAVPVTEACGPASRAMAGASATMGRKMCSWST